VTDLNGPPLGAWPYVGQDNRCRPLQCRLPADYAPELNGRDGRVADRQPYRRSGGVIVGPHSQKAPSGSCRVHILPPDNTIQRRYCRMAASRSVRWCDGVMGKAEARRLTRRHMFAAPSILHPLSLVTCLLLPGWSALTKERSSAGASAGFHPIINPQGAAHRCLVSAGLT
jgi:hypothetical protein